MFVALASAIDDSSVVGSMVVFLLVLLLSVSCLFLFSCVVVVVVVVVQFLTRRGEATPRLTILTLEYASTRTLAAVSYTHLTLPTNREV